MSCPEKLSLGGHGSEKTASVYRWEDCSRLCRQRQGCRYWTWRDRTSGIRALQCKTFSDERPYKFHNDPGAISGERRCGVESSFPNGPQMQCPSQGLSIGVNKGYFQYFLAVESWEECARKCRANVNVNGKGKICKYWTWDRNAHNCTVIDEADYMRHKSFDINESKHIFSGDRTCVGRGVQGNFHLHCDFIN